MNSARLSIQNYVLAKDGNRPYLLNSAFMPQAVLDMVVNTGSISFPPHVEGLEGIAEVLVSRFGQTFENVYTFCLGRPPQADAETFDCTWLVGMSDKSTGQVRVGCGLYQWRFHGQSKRVEHLTITIEHMETLPASDLPAVLDWFSDLNYPWSNPEELARSAPSLDALKPVLRYVLDGEAN